MSFYQTSNASIVRFRTVPRKTIAPFQSLQRIVQIQSLGAGYASTGLAIASAITPEQLQNGAIIVNPGASEFYSLPSAYSLQEYLGGRFAFNMTSNQVNVGAGANPMTGLNDFFLVNVYNIATNATTLVSFSQPATQAKTITAATIANDAVLTPVLIQFQGNNSQYATINGVANSVSYIIY